MAKKQYKKTIFGLALELVLKRKGLDQKEFGLSIGINQSNLSGYVTGRTSPTLKSMQQITKALGYGLIAFLQIGSDAEEGKTPDGEAASPASVAESEPSEMDGPAEDAPPPLYEATLGEIRELLTAQVQATQEQTKIAEEAQAERDQRIKEFEEHIESLREGIRAREDRIGGLQRKFNDLLSGYKADTTRQAETIEFLQGQVKYYQDDGERLKRLYEAEKKTVDAKDAMIALLITGPHAYGEH